MKCSHGDIHTTQYRFNYQKKKRIKEKQKCCRVRDRTRIIGKRVGAVGALIYRMKKCDLVREMASMRREKCERRDSFFLGGTLVRVATRVNERNAYIS
jgi:hypothetical protein